jgi:hypothetical protein
VLPRALPSRPLLPSEVLCGRVLRSRHLRSGLLCTRLLQMRTLKRGCSSC